MWTYGNNNSDQKEQEMEKSMSLLMSKSQYTHEEGNKDEDDEYYPKPAFTIFTNMLDNKFNWRRRTGRDGMSSEALQW